MAYPDNIPYYLTIARGPANGEDYVNKFGYSSKVTQTAQVVWSAPTLGAYEYLTAEDYVIIGSDDTNDDGAGADTGARTVEVTGVQGSYTLTTATITTKGFVAATSSVKFLRVFRMKVTSAGTSGKSEGRIWCLPDATGNTFTAVGVPTTTSKPLSTLDTGANQTLQANYTIPLGFKGYLLDWWISSQNNKSHIGDLYAREAGGVFQLKEKLGFANTRVGHEFTIPDQFDAGTDIEIRAAASSTVSLVSAGFNILLTQGD